MAAQQQGTCACPSGRALWNGLFRNALHRVRRALRREEAARPSSGFLFHGTCKHRAFRNDKERGSGLVLLRYWAKREQAAGERRRREVARTISSSGIPDRTVLVDSGGSRLTGFDPKRTARPS